MKTNYDGVTELKFSEARFKGIAKKPGAPIKPNKCFICGNRVEDPEKDICEDCEKDFPKKDE